MGKYTFDCAMGHNKVTFNVQADNDDDALEQLIKKAKPHLMEAHSDMGEMSDSQIGAMIKEGWEKS